MSRRPKVEMRREPFEPFRPAAAFLGIFESEFLLLFTYADPGALEHDWRRTTPSIVNPPGLTRTRSASLEKTRSGRPWIDFGIREYRGRDGSGPQEGRIAIPVVVGGDDRNAALRRVARCREFWCLFEVFDPATLPGWERVRRGLSLSHHPATAPVRLAGLMSLGRLVRTASRRPAPQVRDVDSTLPNRRGIIG